RGAARARHRQALGRSGNRIRRRHGGARDPGRTAVFGTASDTLLLAVGLRTLPAADVVSFRATVALAACGATLALSGCEAARIHVGVPVATAVSARAARPATCDRTI